MLPITSLGLNHDVSDERISTGIPRLDAMLGGKGFFRGSSILLIGHGRHRQDHLAATFAEAACRRGERVLFFSFEESPPDHPQHAVHRLRPGTVVKQGLLRFHSARASLYGLEMHLAIIHKIVQDFDPQVVVLDPVGT